MFVDLVISGFLSLSESLFCLSLNSEYTRHYSYEDLKL